MKCYLRVDIIVLHAVNMSPSFATSRKPSPKVLAEAQYVTCLLCGWTIPSNSNGWMVDAVNRRHHDAGQGFRKSARLRAEIAPRCWIRVNRLSIE